MCEIIKFLNSNSGAIMALTSFMMLVVSGFLACNARRMRLINEESIKIAAWEKRWKLYDEITDWPIRVEKYLPSREMVTVDSGREAAKSINLRAVEIGSVLKQSKLVFHKDPEIITFLEKYHSMITPLIKLEIGTEITVDEVNRSLVQFNEWIKQEFYNKVENNFLNVLSLDY